MKNAIKDTSVCSVSLPYLGVTHKVEPYSWLWLPGVISAEQEKTSPETGRFLRFLQTVTLFKAITRRRCR
jgi:hypothetical protein